MIDGVLAARANPLNAAHRPHHLLSGLLQCGVCGGACVKRGQDRYACSNHARTDSCTNRRSIRRVVLEERVLAGLKHRLMAPEAAAEAIRAYAEETNRLNRERLGANPEHVNGFAAPPATGSRCSRTRSEGSPGSRC